MSIIAALGIAVLSAAALALAVVIFRFNQKRLHIARCAASAPSGQLERIYTLVEQAGTVPSNGYVLARANKDASDSRCLIPIPNDLQDFPWAGRTIEATASNQVEFRFIEAPITEPMLLGRVYRPVRVPRHQTKNSTKQRNAYSPQQYIGKNPDLLSALGDVCRKYPEDLLSYLLCVGRESFEFEPIDQVRIGASPAWVQDPEHPICDDCKKRMRLVLQLPGTLVSKKSFHRGTFYLFGCTTHPRQTKSLGQFT